MKKIVWIFFAFSVATLFWSCGQSDSTQEHNEAIAELEDEIDELQNDKSLIREEYDQVIDIINEIDEQLIDIDAREKQMDNMIGDLSGSALQKEQIMARINLLKEQNIKAQKAANALQEKLNSVKTENNSINKIIKQYEVRLKEKDQEIAGYEIKMNQIEAQLKYTENELATQYALVAKQRDSLRNQTVVLSDNLKVLEEKNSFIAECVKGYYLSGTKKQLKEKGVLKKIGVKLQDNFQSKIDKTAPINFYTETELSFERPILAVLPERPAASYRIDGNNLSIKKPETFWENRDAIIVLK